MVPIEPMLEISSDPPDIGNPEWEAKARQEALKLMPRGYSFEVSGVARVDPGKDLLFSVPANHVSANWYMRVKFALEVNSSSIATGPFTYLEFHSYDIPKQ